MLTTKATCVCTLTFFFEGEAVSVTSTAFQTGPHFLNITNMSYNKIYTMYLQYIYKIGIENHYIHWFYIEHTKAEIFTYKKSSKQTMKVGLNFFNF